MNLNNAVLSVATGVTLRVVKHIILGLCNSEKFSADQHMEV
jgi:hypothetical protein